MPEPPIDTANVHLDILGQARDLTLEVRVGPCRLTDLLPPARRLSAEVSAVAVADAAARGRSVSCRQRCAACCRHLVPISSVEAKALAELVAAMPAERRERVRRRFSEAARRMEEAGLLDARAPRGRHALISSTSPGRAAWEDVSRRYFAAAVACPFLEDESCSIYEDRPMVCREYMVTTPAEWCGALDPRVQGVERPARLSEALADAACAITGLEIPSIPLALALEWAEVHGGALEGAHDGEAMFVALLGAMDPDQQTPFEERGGRGADD